jgi:hypothetical protein
MPTTYRLEDLKGRGHLEDLGVYGKIILKLILKMGWEVLDWIYFAEHRDRWRPPVNAAMKIWVP